MPAVNYGESQDHTGGARDEAGGQYRRALAALFVAYGLNGVEFPGLPLGGHAATVETVALEVDAAVDDILVGFADGRFFVQAKRTLHFGRPFDEVVTQWINAVRGLDVDPDRDFLGAAAGTLSKPLLTLALTLDRLRLDAAAPLTQSERGVIDKLRSLLVRFGATAEEQILILRRAILIERAVEDDSQPGAEHGRLLLDGQVVKKGEGARAWRELVGLAGRAARLRIGHTMGGWLDELRRAGLPLTADAEGSRAAQLERRHAALGHYRRQLIERGGVVDLTSVGARLGPIPFVDIDAVIGVRTPGEIESTNRSLLWAFRRRGRVMVTGLPGGGKTTAVAAAVGEWAKRDDWALPIAVSLRRLAERERFRKRPLREEILDLAVERVESSERALVRDALDEALATGGAVLFLDGLDEAFDRSLELAADISRLLQEVHADTDILVSTRDAAYADASILQLKDLVLGPPQEPRRAARAVLHAAAIQRGCADVESWVERRISWVNATLAADRALSETPLLPILLALLAAESEVDDLPSTRGRILSAVVNDVVRRYEIKREAALVESLGTEHTAEALIGVFPLIASALSRTGGSAPRAMLVDALLPYLEDAWGLPPAVARSSAGALVRFWDECGIFVARGREKVTAPRVQLFLEIGAALDGASRPNSARRWVDQYAARRDGRESLILAAGLCEAIAESLIDKALTDGDARLAHAAATSLTEGGQVSGEHFRCLTRLLIDSVGNRDAQAWQIFTTLARLPLPADLQDAALGALAIFDREHVVVGTALAALEWKFVAERRDVALEAVLRIVRLPSLRTRAPHESPQATIYDLLVDQTLMRVKERAAETLLPGRPELASVVVAAMEGASSDTTLYLTEILRQQGHGDLAGTAFKKRFPLEAVERLARQAAGIDADIDRTLETIARLAVPGPLTRTQQRRLDELASFLDTIGWNNSGGLGREAFDGVREAWYRLIATLGGFDCAILSAEADVVRAGLDPDDPRHQGFFHLFDAPRAGSLTRWCDVPDARSARALAVTMLAGPWAAAVTAANALATHPERADTSTAIQATLHALPRRSTRPAVWALLKLAADVGEAATVLAADVNAAVREAVASAVGLTDAGRPTPLGEILATDSARAVQMVAIEQFKKDIGRSTAEMIALLQRVAAKPPKPFVCDDCGTANSAERDSCVKCHIVAARPNIEAARLLARLLGSPG